AAVVLAKIAKRVAIQMPTVRRIAKGTEIRVMRRDNQNLAARREQPVKLLHTSDHIGNVLDDVNCTNKAKLAVGERIRKAVQVAQDVGPARRIAVDSDRTRIFLNAATDVKCSG